MDDSSISTYRSKLSGILLASGLCVFFWFDSVHAAEKVVLQLKWFHQFQFAGYYAALKQGYYADEGLDVEIRHREPNHIPTQEVLQGNAQFGISDSTLVLERLRGKPLVSLAAIFQHSPLVLMSLKESNIIHPLELSGKRVMYQRNVDDAVITATFVEVGLKKDDFTHVPHNFNDNVLLTGVADVMAAYITDQPYYYKEKGIELNIIAPANYGIDFYGDMLFTSENFLRTNPHTVEAFRRASLKGWDYALQHPEEIVDWILDIYPHRKSRKNLLYEAEMSARLIKPNLIELGHINSNRFLRIANTYKQLGLAPIDVELTGINYAEYIQGSRIHPDSRKWLYITWAILAITVVIAFVLWAINRHLQSLVAHRTQALEESRRALEVMTLTDPLTGLGNRRKLDDFISHAFAQAKRYDYPLTVMMFDIDDFKQVNDQHGHAAGDLVLQQLAVETLKRVRESDLLGRWGGEEFMLICPKTDKAGAGRLAELLRHFLQGYQFTGVGHLTCSFGIAEWNRVEDSSSLFNQVDHALYQAKKQGGGRSEPITTG